MPFTGDGHIAEHRNTKRVKSAQTISFCTMFNVQRVLGDSSLTSLTPWRRKEAATRSRV